MDLSHSLSRTQFKHVVSYLKSTIIIVIFRDSNGNKRLISIKARVQRHIPRTNETNTVEVSTMHITTSQLDSF